jgi:K+-sensing histidine kinase KdpD
MATVRPRAFLGLRRRKSAGSAGFSLVGLDAGEELTRFSEILHGEAGLGEAAGRALARLVELFRLEGAVLMVEEEGVLKQLARYPFEPPKELLGFGASQTMDAFLGIRGSLAVAGVAGTRVMGISIAGTPVGALGITGRGLSKQEDLLFKGFAHQIGLAIERERLFKANLRLAVLEKVDQFRQALLGSVAHDLRTPIAAAQAALRDAADWSLPLSQGERQELMDLALECMGQMSSLVDDVLILARIEAGKLRPSVELVNLTKLIDGSLRAARINASPVKVHINQPNAVVEVDLDLMSQAIGNLVANSIRFSRDGSDVEIVAGVRDSEVVVEVLDRGPGVPAQQRSLVFDQFWQGRKDGGGSGLGLAIAKAFVEAHNGRISISDREGGGAVFSIVLPQGPGVHGEEWRHCSIPNQEVEGLSSHGVRKA